MTISSLIEFGANIGNNLLAIKDLLPDIEISAIEINELAAKKLSELKEVKVYQQSILNFDTDYLRDFVLIKGVLIHINPNELKNVYKRLYSTSKNYICIVEYYSPFPVKVNYRGHDNKLFKRDFAGEMLDMYSDLELVDYGFIYHLDKNFPQDDASWFLLKKTI